MPSCQQRMPTAMSQAACRDGRDRGEAEPGKFPFQLVALLCLGMTVNSYTLVSLFPYVGMMVKDLLNLETINEAGFYAGYLASAFTLGRFLSGYVWGRLTDKVGRKPVMILSLLSIMTWSVSFGLSTTYTWAMISRLILGLTNSIIVPLRTVLNEVCGPEHVVQGMAYLNGSKSFSYVLGAGIGGLLAQPALHYPGTFSATGLFGRYPYLLPNLVGASAALVTLVAVVLFLPETKGYTPATGKHAALQLDSNSDKRRVEPTTTTTTATMTTVITPRAAKTDDNYIDATPRVKVPGSPIVSSPADTENHPPTPTIGFVFGSSKKNYRQLTAAGGGGGQGIKEDSKQSEEEEKLGDYHEQQQQDPRQAQQSRRSSEGGGEYDSCALIVVNAVEEVEGGETTNGSGGRAGDQDGGRRRRGGGGGGSSPEHLDYCLPTFCAKEDRGEGGEWHEGEGEVEEPGLCGPDGLLATPYVPTILFLACVLQMLQLGLEEAYPLFAFSTPDVGGLGFDSKQIGQVLVVTGFLVAGFTLILSPLGIKALGLTTWQRTGCLLSMPARLAIPAVKALSWNYPSLFAVSVATYTVDFVALGAVNIALSIGSTTLVPTYMRGKLGGLYNTAESLGRCMGPAGFAVTYAWSISPSARDAYGGWVNYRFVFCASAVILAFCTVLAWGSLTDKNLMAGKTEQQEEGGDGDDDNQERDNTTAAASGQEATRFEIDSGSGTGTGITAESSGYSHREGGRGGVGGDGARGDSSLFSAGGGSMPCREVDLV
ncbi:unnamed protein product [Pylaiella littoralis]